MIARLVKGRIGVAFALSYAFAIFAVPGFAATEVIVHEITMAAPDIIRVEVRDGEIAKGPLIGPLSTPDIGSYNTFLNRTNPKTGLIEKAQVVGPTKTYLKFMDKPTTSYLNRAAADDAKSYGPIGARTVTKVYRRSEPYDYGQIINAAGSSLASASSMRHYLYLKLNGNLEQGAHTVVFPVGTGLAKAPFVFNDKITRASSIRSSQVGHRRGDVMKYAYLSQWIPGMVNEGAIDFASQYSITTFHIVDAGGKIRFTGPIIERITPTQVEANSGWPSNIRYASSATPPKVITAITRASPGVVTSITHGFSNGDFVMLRGIGGMVQLEGLTFKVANVTRDTFSLQTTAGIDINTTSYGTYNPTAYISGYSGLIYATYLANRAATYVFGMDYSLWLAHTPGLYRIYIPGLGVSDEFRVDEAVWYKVAKNAAAGEYHHRHGIVLDGRFGFVRGVTFKDGVDGTKIYWSRLPAIFSTEWARITNKVLSAKGADPATWMTVRRATGWFGGTMDAGDWDESVDAHVLAYYWLLDLGYEKLPTSSRNINFGLPKSTEVLDAELYAGTDVLPDSVHQAIWYLDAYRRLQREDGATGGGLGFAGGGAGNSYEASSISRIQAFIYAPDPVSNYIYAVGAAKVATVLKAEGFTSLAAVWTASAERAWSWAEAIYQSGLGDGVLRDAYFIGELNVKANAGWSDAQYKATMSELQTLMSSRRLAAAGTLFRLTEKSNYRAIVETYISGGYGLSGYPGIGLWEYVYSPVANPRLKNTVLKAAGGFQQFKIASLAPYMTGKIGYKNHSTINSVYIGNVWPVSATLQSFIRTGEAALLGMMQDGQALTLGANQTGFSYTNGLGYRTLARTTLHLDARYLGLNEAPIGITHYGWDQPGIQFRFFNFSTDAPINFTAETPTGKYEADHGMKKIYEPYRLSVPFAEHTVQNPFIIYHMEYTFHQTIIPQQIIAMWLHAWDGNTATEFSDRQIDTRQP